MNEVHSFFSTFVGDFSFQKTPHVSFPPWLQAGVWLLNLAELSSFKARGGGNGSNTGRTELELLKLRHFSLLLMEEIKFPSNQVRLVVYNPLFMRFQKHPK